MTKKMYLGIAALIVFMIAAGGFIYWNVSTVQQMKKQTALFEELLEKEQKPVAAKEPPPAAPGKKWVPHGDHFHEVPIDAPDTWQGEQVHGGPPPGSVREIGGVHLDANGYIILDMSFLDNPEKAMEEIAEVLLHPDRYLPIQVGEARQKDSILNRKIRDHYYGKGSYSDKYENADRLKKLRDETYMNEVRRMLGIDIEAIEAAVKSGQPYAIPKPQLPKGMPLPGEDSK